MKMLRAVLALVILGSFALGALSTEAVAQKKKGSFGKVTKLELKKDDDGKVTSGNFVLESKKKNDTEVTKTNFKLTDKTKVLNGPKEKGGDSTPGDWKDLKDGVVVSIQTAADATEMAATITIFMMKKKKDTN